MTFRVGQRVECVDDSPDYLGRPLVVSKGSKYTIADVFDLFGETGVTLLEVDPGAAPGWRASRFRAVVERKTDISIFKRLLVPGTKIHESA